MEYNIETEGEIVTISLSGNFVRSMGEEIKTKIAELTVQDFRYLLLDMGNVPLIDSYGVTVCIAFYKMVRNRGLFVIIRPSQAVEKVFHITQADQKFHIVNNKEEALRAIQEKTQDIRDDK